MGRTIKVNESFQMDKLFICPRCDNYANKMTSMGRWQCCFHPGTYDVDKGYSCCGRKVRPLAYIPTYVILGAHEENVREPKGCTPCDCGDDLSNVHIESIAHNVDQIDINQWKGFEYPYLYRSKYHFDNR